MQQSTNLPVSDLQGGKRFPRPPGKERRIQPVEENALLGLGPLDRARVMRLQAFGGNRAVGKLLTSSHRTTSRPVQRSFLIPAPTVSQTLRDLPGPRIPPFPSRFPGKTASPRYLHILDMVNRYEKREVRAKPGPALTKRRDLLENLVVAIRAHLGGDDGHEEAGARQSQGEGLTGDEPGQVGSGSAGGGEPAAGRARAERGKTLAIRPRIEDELAQLRFVVTALSFEGQLQWVAASGIKTAEGKVDSFAGTGRHNEFIDWLQEPEAPEPGAGSMMNCWEAVLFMAFKAGLVSKVDLRRVYQQAVAAARLDEGKQGVPRYDVQRYLNGLKNHLMSKGQTAFQYDPKVDRAGTPDPPAGSIVTIKFPRHVVLATGGRRPNGHHEVMSNWAHNPPDADHVPAGGGTFARVTLEAFFKRARDDVFFAPAPW